MKPMRSVGPKKGYRVFDGQVFTLGFFRNRGVRMQEYPEAQARLQAKAIRELGVNARVVKGKGWAAVYVAEKKKRSKVRVSEIKSRKGLDDGSWNSKVKTKWKVNVDGQNLPLTKARTEVLAEWGFDESKPVTKEQGMLKRKGELKKGMSVRFWEDTDYFEKQGLGRLKPTEQSSLIYRGDFKDDSQVTDIKVINLKSPEGIEFYTNLGMGGQKNNRQESFKNWLNNAGKRRERKWKNNPLLEDYYDFFINGNEIDLDIFVVFIDNQMAFWSPAQGDFAKKSMKAIEEFKGWDRFTSDGRGKRA
jgi:hypothetical protein